MAKQIRIYALLPGIPHVLFTITLSHLSFVCSKKEGSALRAGGSFCRCQPRCGQVEVLARCTDTSKEATKGTSL